jgi:hypothetical protein
MTTEETLNRTPGVTPKPAKLKVGHDTVMINLALSHLAFFTWWNELVVSEQLNSNETRARQLLTWMKKEKKLKLNSNTKKFTALASFAHGHFDKGKDDDLPDNLAVGTDLVLNLIDVGLTLEFEQDPALAASTVLAVRQTFRAMAKVDLKQKLYETFARDPSTGMVKLPVPGEDTDGGAAKAQRELVEKHNATTKQVWFSCKVDMRYLLKPPPALFARAVKPELVKWLCNTPWSFDYQPAIIVLDDTEDFWQSVYNIRTIEYFGGDPRGDLRLDDEQFKEWCKVSIA